MRVLQVLPDPYRATGGILVHVKSISERLAKKHDVTVYATNRGLKLPRYELRNGVKVERFNCYAPGDAYYLSPEMLVRLRKARFDVVHAHGYHAFPFHFSAEAKCEKFIATPHFHGQGHSTFRDSLIRLLKPAGKRTLSKAKRIIAVSEYERNLIGSQFKFNLDKVEVIPNGVDFEEFSNLKKRNRGFRSILYVGYLAEYKGPQYLIEVMRKLRDDVILEIVGHGPLRPWLENRARTLNVSERVRFYDFLSRQDLVQKYADADIFCLLSNHEAYSIVVAEALTAGTPCIVARSSALTEWVDSETCFGIALPINLNKLADLINYLLNNPTNTHDTRKWRGTKILSWDDVTRRVEAVYESKI